jgi:hypothetical protein
VDDATFKNVSGRALFTAGETKQAQKALANAKAKFAKVKSFSNVLRKRSDILAELNMFINIKVRAGDISFSAEEFIDWFMRKKNIKIGDLKKVESKRHKRGMKNEQVGFMIRTKKDIQQVFDFREAVTKVKRMLVRKLETVQGIGTFLRTDDGFKVTAPEGFVAVDTLSNKALKLVDRLEFSRANFTAAKDWVKGG